MFNHDSLRFETQCCGGQVAALVKPLASRFSIQRPLGWIKVFWYLLLCQTLMGGFSLFGASVPAGFSETVIASPSGGNWNEAIGLTFENNGRMYVWERAGRVWFKDVSDSGFSLLLDIQEEVAAMLDHGLLGFALDPNFRQNGHIYLLYVVDRHHLLYFGTPNYNPSANLYDNATIARLTRYTCRSSDGFRSVDPASRLILIGETKQTGFAILSESHGIGSLVFGQDGTLLVSCGDGASPTGTDLGGNVGGSWAPQGRTDGIISLKEDIGAFRSQLVDCHNGKVLRIDPATGNGIPSNPFYDSANPRSPRSRVWALGLRNPCRMSLRPESGSHNPADGNPGVLYIGDAGWNDWEELDVVTGPGQNFGWPLYEGLAFNSSYDENITNRDALNPFYPTSGCSQFFTFKQLLKEDTLDPAGLPPFANPCNTAQNIPNTIPQFVHKRPVLDWNHYNATTRTPVYDASGQAETANVGASGSSVSGTQFQGNCVIGGDWYSGTSFPAPYRNTYFVADYGANWIKSVEFDVNNKPVVVRNFLSNGGAIVKVTQNPLDGSLYYISWTTTIRKIAYTGNRTPVAAASANVYFGPSPIEVQFSSAGSGDPDGQAVTYAWNFGDGSPVSTLANASHTFFAPAGVPTKFIVTLTVTDSLGLSAQTNLMVSVNNTPPNVIINSPVDGSLFSPGSGGSYNLVATVVDSESSDAELSYEWQTFLYHNEHKHNGPPDTNHVTSTVIAPTGCDGINIYNYGIVLTVTDPGGLSSRREVKLYPDCGPNTPPTISDILDQTVGQDTATAPLAFTVTDYETVASTLLLSATSSNPTLVPSGNVVFGGSSSNRTVTVIPATGEVGSATITVTVSDGPLSASDVFNLTVTPALSGTKTYTNAAAITISDVGAGSPYPSLINVTGLGGMISNVTARLINISHTFPDDIDLLLMSPTGQTVLLMSDAGGSSDLNDVTMTFSDAAAAALSNSGQLTSGTFKPTNFEAATDSFTAPAPPGPYATNLFAFNGQPANGTWSLYVMDDGAGDAGTIDGGWSLTITTTNGATPTISDIPDQTTTANTATAAIPFTVSDVDTPAGSLALSPGSSNPTLVPTNNIVFGGGESNRSVIVTPVPGQTGTATITVTVSDGTSSASDTFVLTVNAVNTPPTLTLPADAAIPEIALYVANAAATDTDTPPNSLDFALVSGPEGLIVSVSGAIAWTPREDQGPSTNIVSIRVTDNGSPVLSATNSYTLIVAEVNTPPVLALPLDATIDELTTYSANATATDIDIPTNSLSFALVSGPDGLTVSASGAIAWTPHEDQGPSTNIVSIRVTDSGSPTLNATNSYTLIVAEVNTPPVLALPVDTAISKLALYTAHATATDTDRPTNRLNFSIVSGPDGLTVSTSGEIAWTPAQGQGPSTNLVTILVTDDGSPAMSATNSYTVIVGEVNVAPVLEPISNRFLNAGQTLSITNSASDTDIPPQLLTFSLLSFPSGATIDATNGIFNWRPTVAQADSTNNVEIMVTDNGSPSLSATQNFTVTVNRLSPPQVTEIAITNGRLTLLITGHPGPDYSVQASTDLTLWTDLFVTNSPTPPFSCTISNVEDFAVRFFRVLLKP